MNRDAKILYTWIVLFILYVVFVFLLHNSLISIIDTIETQIDRDLKGGHLICPYQGWTYGMPYRICGDTVFVYKYIDSVHIWSGESDTLKIRKKWEAEK